MKNIERGTVKHLIVLIITMTIFGLIFYPLVDFLGRKILSVAEFKYSVDRHVVQPIIFAFTYSIIFWAVDRKRKK